MKKYIQIICEKNYEFGLVTNQNKNNYLSIRHIRIQNIEVRAKQTPEDYHKKVPVVHLRRMVTIIRIKSRIRVVLDLYCWNEER